MAGITNSFLSGVKLRWLFYFLLGFSVVSKAFLVGKGFLSMPDEFIYTTVSNAVQSLSEGDLKSTFEYISLTRGRPGDCIVKMIPLELQRISSSKLGLSLFETKNAFPLFAFNYILFLLILFFIYLISFELTQNKLYALLSVVIYSNLTNSYVYLRHAFPYDFSLFVFLSTIWYIIHRKKKSLSYLNAFLMGFWSFFGFLCYPGYFPLLALCGVIIIFDSLDLSDIIKNTGKGISYIVGAFLMFLIFEGIARFVSRSYFLDSASLSGTITQGSFEESFVFLFNYLIDVDGVRGFCFLIGLMTALLFAGLSLFSRENSLSNTLFVGIMLSLFLSYVLYATSGYFFHKMVFYGRLLHPYIALGSIGVVYSYYRLANRLPSFKVLGFILTAPLLFDTGFFNFLKVTYPRDVAWDLKNKVKESEIKDICELGDWSVFPAHEGKSSSGGLKLQLLDSANYLIVNACFFYPINDINDFKAYVPDTEYVSLFESQHFINHKAYQYEGLSVGERKNIDSLNLKIKVFKRL